MADSSFRSTGLRRVAGHARHALRRLASRRQLPAEGQVWLCGELTGPLAELGDLPRPGGGRRPALLDLLRTLERAGRDERVSGLLLRWRGSLESHVHAEALRRAIDGFRATGRSVAIWADELSTVDYRVAAAADHLWMPPLGSLSLLGLRSEQLYWGKALDRWDVRADVVHVGRYKSAGEQLTRSSMSEAQREQIERYQGDVFERWLADVARGRQREPEAVRARVDDGPCGAREAAEQGWIDDVLYPDEIEARLEAALPATSLRQGPRRRVRSLDWQRYQQIEVDVPPPLRAPSLVYAVASGAIRRRGAGPSEEALLELLDELREHGDVRGVVLRIDSPGGDALASDHLHHALERLVDEKPVVVSMGGVAASGGYYLAAAADAILAEAATLTGSIGVVGGKLDLSGLYERVGMAPQAVEQGASAGMYSSARAFSPGERRAVRAHMEAVYDVFLDRVAKGRSLARETLEPLAQGRIWSGSRALELGLVDALGGPLEALAEVARRAGLDPRESYALTHLPRPTPLAMVRALLGIGG